MIIISDIPEMQRIADEHRALGHRIGFVPTMGYLHEGHLDLLRIARNEADIVVLSIFVNPTQFSAGEDLDRYPRDFEHDCALAKAEGCDIVLSPDAAQMYPVNDCTWVNVEQLGAGLEGASRPTHFRGVTTVVAKLFHIVRPHFAVFGQKDAQQAAIIRRMTGDLHFGIDIRIAPIRRESDGLAMSSRNTYLSDQDRREALALSRALRLAEEQYEAGERRTASLRSTLLDELQRTGAVHVDYAAIVHPDTFEPAGELISDPVLIAIAARVGRTRLIDNTILGEKAKAS